MRNFAFEISFRTCWNGFASPCENFGLIICMANQTLPYIHIYLHTFYEIMLERPLTLYGEELPTNRIFVCAQTAKLIES